MWWALWSITFGNLVSLLPAEFWADAVLHLRRCLLARGQAVEPWLV